MNAADECRVLAGGDPEHQPSVLAAQCIEKCKEEAKKGKRTIFWEWDAFVDFFKIKAVLEQEGFSVHYAEVISVTEDNKEYSRELRSHQLGVEPGKPGMRVYW